MVLRKEDIGIVMIAILAYSVVRTCSDALQHFFDAEVACALSRQGRTLDGSVRCLRLPFSLRLCPKHAPLYREWSNLTPSCLKIQAQVNANQFEFETKPPQI